MATVKCVYGAPCSGKSTYVRENVGANDIVWDLDLVRNAIAGQSERSSDEQNDMILRLRDTYMSACSESPCDIAWFICTKVTDRIRSALGEGTEYIEMKATEAECLERLEADDSRTDKDLYKELIHDFFHESEVRTMPIKNDREYRDMKLAVEEIEDTDDPQDEQEEKMIVRGYASTFEEPYTLMEGDDFVYNEVVDKDAFKDTDMSDVIMQYDHQGRVFARMSNDTLRVSTDDKGLLIEADLSGTELGRQLYEEIKGGYTNKMSFGFTVKSDDTTRTEGADGRAVLLRRILNVGKLYDVSAVSVPANDATSISVRNLTNGVIEQIQAERLEAERLELRKRKLILQFNLTKGD